MKIRVLVSTVIIFGMALQMFALTPANNKGKYGQPVNNWEINIRQMPPEFREKITETMEHLKGNEEDRSILTDILSSAGMGLASGLTSVIVNETFNLIQYRKKQKQEWLRMIQNENNYTDSITSLKGLKDFYTSNSRKGALDPSNINFDGIEIRGTRNDQEVLYMSCSIDRSNLQHLFHHSKFNLVLDTLSFNPYYCHLPNVTANGIKTMNEIKEGKTEVRNDTILRPGTGANGFSFDERKNLNINIDFSIYSSWINQATLLNKNIELGNFKFTVSIPDSIIGRYTYSRNEILAKADKIRNTKQRDEFLSENLISVEGDSFVVPRSFMPLNSGEPMWGTGEYNIKVKISESCEFKEDSEKGKNWKTDYKRLRKMKKNSNEVTEYFTTLWNQYGNTLIKTTYSNALNSVVKGLSGKK